MTSSIAQTINSRLGRSTISAAISLSIVAVAAFALYELLHDIDFGKVAAALRALSIEKIVAAGAFVVAGHVTLTFYDLFALRTIGRHKVPYSVAALASFTSSTIGHSLGASPAVSSDCGSTRSGASPSSISPRSLSSPA